MAKKRLKPECDNCKSRVNSVGKRGDRKLCLVCATSMPGIYAVGGSGEHSMPATVMRQISFCTNLILAEIRRLHGDGGEVEEF